MQHPRLVINQGILVRERAFTGPWILEFYDSFEDLQAVAFSAPEAEGGAEPVFRANKDFLDRLIGSGYGKRFDLLRAPAPISAPGRIRVRQAIDGKCLFDTDRAVDIKIYRQDSICGAFYRVLSDDVWAWSHSGEADWRQTLTRLGAPSHKVKDELV